MTQFDYLNIEFTVNEQKEFKNLDIEFAGQAMKWLACNEEAVLVECESRLVPLTWDQTHEIISMQTIKMIKDWCGERANEFVKNCL